MAKIDIKNIDGNTVGQIELSDDVWAVDVNEHLLWEAVKWQRAKRRSGTASTKTVAMVSGSGKKPFKQKGTGNARQGSTRSHHMVGGGKAFGPHPRSYDYAFPKQARKGALRSALSQRVKEQKVIVLDEFAIGATSKQLTKQVIKALAALGATNALIVDAKDNKGLIRGARNLERTRWLAPEGLNVYDVLAHDTLIITRVSAERVDAALRPAAE